MKAGGFRASGGLCAVSIKRARYRAACNRRRDIFLHREEEEEKKKKSTYWYRRNVIARVRPGSNASHPR